MLLFYLTLIDNEKEQSTFAQLYNKYRKLMKYIARDILKDDQLAEDAVHNAFLRLIKYLNNIDDVECHKTKALIVVVTKSTAIDMQRKRKKETAILNFDIISSVAVDDDYFNNFDSTDVAQALGKIHDNYSQVLILRYINEYDEKTIAKILNISYDATRKRLQYAKSALKKVLTEDENDD